MLTERLDLRAWNPLEVAESASDDIEGETFKRAALDFVGDSFDVAVGKEVVEALLSIQEQFLKPKINIYHNSDSLEEHLKGKKDFVLHRREVLPENIVLMDDYEKTEYGITPNLRMYTWEG